MLEEKEASLGNITRKMRLIKDVFWEKEGGGEKRRFGFGSPIYHVNGGVIYSYKRTKLYIFGLPVVRDRRLKRRQRWTRRF